MKLAVIAAVLLSATAARADIGLRRRGGLVGVAHCTDGGPAGRRARGRAAQAGQYQAMQ